MNRIMSDPISNESLAKLEQRLEKARQSLKRLIDERGRIVERLKVIETEIEHLSGKSVSEAVADVTEPGEIVTPESALDKLGSLAQQVEEKRREAHPRDRTLGDMIVDAVRDKPGMTPSGILAYLLESGEYNPTSDNPMGSISQALLKLRTKGRLKKIGSQYYVTGK